MILRGVFIIAKRYGYIYKCVPMTMKKAIGFRDGFGPMFSQKKTEPNG